MKRTLIAVLGASASLATCALAAEAPVELKTDKDKLSYSIGVDIGRSLTNNAIEINPNALAAGVGSVAAGGKALLSETEVTNILNNFRTEMRAKQQERFKKMQAEQAEKKREEGDKNKKEGEAFLAENKKKEGVKTHTVTLPSGQTAELQYKVITTGTGPKPTTNDTVITHYRGTLINGHEFDSSYKRGEPATFAVTGVIKGWTEALLMMPVGSKWQLFIPGELAYGPNGNRNIPPNATLLFDIELIGIKEKTDAANKPK